MFPLFGRKRRDKKRAEIRERPFPTEWLEIIRRGVPYFEVLPETDQRELLGHIQVFLAEKSFEGCGGLTLTDEMRVTIASLACVLILHRDTDYYPELDSILVYPEPFKARVRHAITDAAVIEDEEERVGESWVRGTVILSWDEIQKDREDIDDGFNVVFHEFAHQLDEEDGSANGIPLIQDQELRRSWHDAFERAYRDLCDASDRGEETWLDDYGATHPAEFFAVVVEEFFEEPQGFWTEYPDLYELLRRYFKQDPASFHFPASLS